MNIRLGRTDILLCNHWRGTPRLYSASIDGRRFVLAHVEVTRYAQLHGTVSWVLVFVLFSFRVNIQHHGKPKP